MDVNLFGHNSNRENHIINCTNLRNAYVYIINPWLNVFDYLLL